MRKIGELTAQRRSDKKEAVGVFEEMAELAVVPTQSVLTHEINDDGDYDMTPALGLLILKNNWSHCVPR